MLYKYQNISSQNIYIIHKVLNYLIKINKLYPLPFMRQKIGSIGFYSEFNAWSFIQQSNLLPLSQ